MGLPFLKTQSDSLANGRPTPTDAIHYFYQLFDMGRLDTFCTETNRYAEQKIKASEMKI